MKQIVIEIVKGYYRALGYYPTIIDGLKFKCDPYHIKFWRRVGKGRWEPHTYAILSKFLTPNSVFCDIGAWIGPTVIYFARKCKQVFCFEPDTVAYAFLLWNIQLNGLRNVVPFNIALASGDGIRKMASFGRNLGDGMTSLLNPEKEENIDVWCMKWEILTSTFKIEKVDFMKIDIEGGEFALLPTIKDYLALSKPIVYLSTHAPFLDEGRRREEMRQIIQVMEMYGKCLNNKLEIVQIEDLASDDTLNNFRSFLFLD